MVCCAIEFTARASPFLSTIILLRMCNLEAIGLHLTETPRLAMLHSIWRRTPNRQMERQDCPPGAVSEVEHEGDKTVCCFKDSGSILLSNSLGAHVHPGDAIEFPLAIDSAGAGTELYIHKTSSPTRSRDLYQAPIRYAAQPKPDKREHLYVRAAVSAGRLGIDTIHLPCEVVRDYFYVATRRQAWEGQANLYDTLRISATASPAELRLAFNLRQLELRASSASKLDRATLERAFNLLAQPELRACYDSMLKDTSSPALFPYGGFGSILVAGGRSRDGQTFFARQILSFAPEHRERRFRAPLRSFRLSQRSRHISRCA